MLPPWGGFISLFDDRTRAWVPNVAGGAGADDCRTRRVIAALASSGLVGWGDSNSTAPVCPARGQKAIGMAACGLDERSVTAPVHRCPVFAGRLRTQRGPKERFRRLDATRHSGLLRQGIGSVG